jgi:hypothetical protein
MRRIEPGITLNPKSGWLILIPTADGVDPAPGEDESVPDGEDPVAGGGVTIAEFTVTVTGFDVPAR